MRNVWSFICSRKNNISKILSSGQRTEKTRSNTPKPAHYHMFGHACRSALVPAIVAVNVVVSNTLRRIPVETATKRFYVSIDASIQTHLGEAKIAWEFWEVALWRDINDWIFICAAFPIGNQFFGVRYETQQNTSQIFSCSLIGSGYQYIHWRIADQCRRKRPNLLSQVAVNNYYNQQ